MADTMDVDVDHPDAVKEKLNKMESDFVDSDSEDVPGDDSPAPGTEEDVSVAKDGGIMKKIIKKGTGWETPSKNSEVVVHYVGKLLDGTVFDSSRDRNEPFKFKIGTGQVIKGWDQGVAKMKKGETALLTCKPEYAYGKSGAPKIPADATLQFEVELLDWHDEKDISDAKDGGILKKTITEGEGWDTPKDESKVTVTYKAKTLGGSDRVVAEAADLKFVVGAEEVLEHLEKAVTEMKKKEKALVTVQPAYHSFGPEPVQYEIELVDFQKEKQSWEMQTEEKFEAAARKRQEGNDLFKLGKYKRAAKKYKAAADFFQYDTGLKDDEKPRAKQIRLPCLLNLAACDLKLGQLKECKEHCDKALEIDPQNVKALYRRGCVFSAQDNWAEARRDFERALEIDPKSKEVRDEMTKLKAKEIEQNKKDRQTFGGLFDKLAKLEEAKEKEREAKRKQEERKTHATKKAASTPEPVPDSVSADASTAAAAEKME